MERQIVLHRGAEWTPDVAYQSSRWPNLVGVVLSSAMIAALCVLVLETASIVPYFLGFLGLTGLQGLVLRRVAGRRTKQALFRVATRAEHLPQLQGLLDGQLVRLRGRVRLRAGTTTDDGVVFARTVLKQTVHERAIDFALIDDDGNEVWIDTSDAHLLHPSGEQARLGNHVVRVGDLIEVLGWKDRAVDQSVADRMTRETPTRITLRSQKSLPVLIMPIASAPLLPADGT